MQKSKKVSDI